MKWPKGLFSDDYHLKYSILLLLSEILLDVTLDIFCGVTVELVCSLWSYVLF